MTPEERAEKIVNTFVFKFKQVANTDALETFITDKDRLRTAIAAQIGAARAEGFSAAKKQAAEIAKDWPGPGGIVYCNSMEPVDVMDGLRKGLVTQIEKLDVKP